MSAQSAAPSSSIGWRTPALIIICGCVIAMLGFGPRSSLGFFLTPMSQLHNWGRDVFALALAVQNLLWGVGQPFAGAVADRYGPTRVLAGGALLYAAGLFLMAYSTTPSTLTLSAGVLIGFGLSGCSFTIVVGAFGKLLPDEWRSTAFGLGTAAGSFGQFLFSPLAVALIGSVGWYGALVVFSLLMLIILPLSIVLSAPRKSAAAAAAAAPAQSYKQALTEAFGHRSYILLVLGFFTCGFQLAFTTVHLPAYLLDRGLSAQVGGWTVAAIGLFNIVGSVTSGYLGSRMPKRYILSIIYFSRAASIAAFVLLPVTTTTTLIFGAVTGLLWLSTVPPTSSLVAVMFGTRWLAMLFGIAFFSHQVGGFLGVLLGGLAYDHFGTYDPVWWLGVAFGIISALINLPIVEEPVSRPLVPAAA
ncbi:MFS transporter [Pseudolabrys sp. Root1462]|uniref:MFS transporter n=1 Tax=Pseudolabrys sp. Root1462 TaxID=1736466 RepID=UPI0007029CD0|nr:MFS transporter [Pseudolabrys sp. Root1462]KQZ01809.1 MFS transporter [Pseudolabrys sp. Root1462]